MAGAPLLLVSAVALIDADDRVLEIIGSAGSAPGRFNNPWSLALDSRGNLYVADSQNHRVQKLIRHKPAAEFQVSSFKFSDSLKLETSNSPVK